jgi:hypothetical protein
MNDNEALHVVDPEIILFFRPVTKGNDDVADFLLGLFPTHFSGPFLYFIGGGDVPDDFSHFSEHLPFFRKEVFFEGWENDEKGGGDKQEDGEQGRQGDPYGNRMGKFPFLFLLHARHRLGIRGCSLREGREVLRQDSRSLLQHNDYRGYQQGFFIVLCQ